MTRKFKTPHLIQRIQKATDFENPFTFGGGYRHGGLSDEAWDVLTKIVSFDYMGAAEFEFGALPEAFQGIVDDLNKGLLAAYSITVSTKHTKNKEVFVIAPEEWKGSIKEFLQSEALEKHKFLLKESPMISSGIDGFYSWDKDREPIKDYIRTTGGIDLDYHWMYFFNEGQFNLMKQLFELGTGNE